MVVDTKISENEFIRLFFNVEQDELHWHSDECNREIRVLNSSKDWSFQFVDGLPFRLKNQVFTIEVHKMHRLLVKANTDAFLLLRIKES